MHSRCSRDALEMRSRGADASAQLQSNLAWGHTLAHGGFENPAKRSAASYSAARASPRCTAAYTFDSCSLACITALAELQSYSPGGILLAKTMAKNEPLGAALSHLCHVEAYGRTLAVGAVQWCPARRVIAGNQQARGHAKGGRQDDKTVRGSRGSSAPSEDDGVG